MVDLNSAFLNGKADASFLNPNHSPILHTDHLHKLQERALDPKPKYTTPTSSKDSNITSRSSKDDTQLLKTTPGPPLEGAAPL